MHFKKHTDLWKLCIKWFYILVVVGEKNKSEQKEVRVPMDIGRLNLEVIILLVISSCLLTGSSPQAKNGFSGSLCSGSAAIGNTVRIVLKKESIFILQSLEYRADCFQQEGTMSAYCFT